MTVFKLPVVSGETSFAQYMQEIKRFPSLEPEEEYILAKRFQEHEDIEAAQKLVTSHLKLVVKMAVDYKGYGLPIVELVSEGNIGLMQAVKRFDPDKGFRLSTYAMWWIRASMQEYVLKSWSLVKVGTTSAQKKLFFNLRKIKNRIFNLEARDVTNEDLQKIADDLNVSLKEVKDMNIRMAGNDISLNKPVGFEGDSEMLDLIAENKPDHETLLVERDDYMHKKSLFTEAFKGLTDREREIITERRLKDEPATLDDLSKIYNISRERIRQIEVRAMEKLTQYITDNDMSEVVNLR